MKLFRVLLLPATALLALLATVLHAFGLGGMLGVLREHRHREQRVLRAAAGKGDHQERRKHHDQRHSSGQASTIFQSSPPFLIFFISVVSPPLRRIQSFTGCG